MADKIDDGGPAFPVLKKEDTQQFTALGITSKQFTYEGGMSLRDWFAGMATDDDVSDILSRIEISRAAAKYIHADNMIFQRTCKPPTSS